MWNGTPILLAVLGAACAILLFFWLARQTRAIPARYLRQ